MNIRLVSFLIFLGVLVILGRWMENAIRPQVPSQIDNQAKEPDYTLESFSITGLIKRADPSINCKPSICNITVMTTMPIPGT